MSSTTVLAGRHGPPTNVPAGTIYNPFAGPTTNRPLGFPVGTPVAPRNVDQSAPHTVYPSNATDGTVAHVIGLASTPGVVGKRTNVQSQGVLNLTTEQWDAITGDTGGLVRGNPYYLTPGPGDGHLTQTAPTTPEDFVVRVGIALSPTDLLILICCPVLINGPQNG